MSMRKLANKMIVLGIDGLDPRLTRKYVDMGLMPNVKEYIERGAAREDLVLLGGHPTVTPSMWTTLATGAYSTVHGITDFYRQNPESLDKMDYNLDSRLCRAEQLWNVTAEAGKKTLVWHWPGSAWPPSSDSENLHVVDGSSPGGVSMSNSQFESEYLVYADKDYTDITFRPKSGNEITPCIIKDLDVEDPSKKKKFGTETSGQNGLSVYITKFGEGAGSKEYKFDIAMSPINDAANWKNGKDTEGSKEFTMLLSGGLVRRPCLVKANANGVYDTVEIYKNKKAEEPVTVLQKGELKTYIFDEAIKNDAVKNVVRHMRLLDIAEDGNHVKIFVSAAMEIENDSLFHPKRIYPKLKNQAMGVSTVTAHGMGSTLRSSTFIIPVQVLRFFRLNTDIKAIGYIGTHVHIAFSGKTDSYTKGCPGQIGFHYIPFLVYGTILSGCRPCILTGINALSCSRAISDGDKHIYCG